MKNKFYQGLDIEETLRTLDLVSSGGVHRDIVMHLKSAKAGNIAGESDRLYPDGKPGLPLLGYFFGTGNIAAPSFSDPDGKERSRANEYTPLRVIRESDAATASIMSLTRGDQTLEVDIQVFKASGDANVKDNKATLRIVLSESRVEAMTLVAGGVGDGRPLEIVDFAFRKIQIETAPQQNTGQRGAVRTFIDSRST